MNGAPKVLCLGEVLWDYIADQPDCSRTEVTSWTPYPGGAPANVACVLAQLGTATAFMGAVGQDERGEALVTFLQQQGINLMGVQRCEAPTRRVYVTRTQGGERTFAGFDHAAPTIFADACLQAKRLPSSLFETADYLVLGTLGLASLETCEAIVQALRLAQRHHINVWVDVNWRPMFWPLPEQAKPMILEMLGQAQMLKLSVDEAEWLFETTDPLLIARQVPADVVVTAGAQGCRYQIAGHSGQVPAFPISAVDTTGAGDAFFASFLHQYCQHGLFKDAAVLREMIRYASAVGALTTTQQGAISFDVAQVKSFLNAHS